MIWRAYERRNDPVWSALLTDPTLRAAHGPFTDAIAHATPGSDNYLRHAAVLIILQFLDGRISSEALCHATRALEDLKPKRVRDAVGEVLDSLSSVPEPTPTTLRALERYADALQREGRVDLGAHLYQLLTEWHRRFGDPRQLAGIQVRLTRCLRKLGNRPAAWAASQTGLLAAEIYKDTTARIELLLEQVALCIPERRYDVGARIASEALNAAQIAENVPLVARARHDWGSLITEAYRTTGDASQLIQGLRLLDLAWQSVTDNDDTDWPFRILNDLGRALGLLGYWEVAEEIHRVVYQRARDKDMRWRGGINLMDILICRKDYDGFQAIRRDMDRAHLPPPLRAVYWALVAEGSLAFDCRADVASACARAGRVAKRIRDVSVLEDLAALKDWRLPPRPQPPQDLAPEVRDVGLRIVGSRLPVVKKLRRGRRPNRRHD